MGVRELQSAFNDSAGAAASCSKAFLGYVQAGGTEWQILTFNGSFADGSGFVIKSDRIRPSGDVIIAARQTAQALLDKPDQFRVKT